MWPNVPCKDHATYDPLGHFTAPPGSWFLSDSINSVRTFDTGAIRYLDAEKNDYEGFLDPLVLERYGDYMHRHRKTAAGLRDSDNWQKGIDKASYMKSMLRHVLDVWKAHRGHETAMSLDEALCAVLFNAMGYLHELLKEKKNG